MIIHKIIPQFCGKTFSKKVISQSKIFREDQEREDGKGLRDVVHGDGFMLFDSYRTGDFVEYKDSIHHQVYDMFGGRTEAMLSHFVVQHQKYYEHILRPQIDEIIINNQKDLFLFTFLSYVLIASQIDIIWRVDRLDIITVLLVAICLERKQTKIITTKLAS